MSDKQLATRPDHSPDIAANAFSIQQLLGQVQLIQQVMGATMRDGEHFGKIPGCGDKPTLLKPGAEKLCLTFRLAPAYAIEEKLNECGHREYRIVCTLSSIITGAFVGQGVGVCSTMEAKYRFRKGEGEPTDRPVPRAYWDLRQEDPSKAQEIIGGKGFSTRKIEGKGWMICKGGEKTEHDNPADHYNTVLKIGKKRALVDAVLTATAASDIFTQDLEDISANLAANALLPANNGFPRQADTAEEAGRAVKQICKAPTRNLPDKSPPKKKVSTEFAALDVESKAAPVPADASDWRQVRVHFGKNRGLLLTELTANQVHWYETEWMPKKENEGARIGSDDQALMDALTAYRIDRTQQKKTDGGEDGDLKGADIPWPMN